MTQKRWQFFIAATLTVNYNFAQSRKSPEFRMTVRSARAGLVFAICSSFFVFGCGGGPVLDAEGTVTFDGQPLDSGSISFEPAGKQGREFGGVIQNGTYKVKSNPGAVPGEAIVRIRGARKTGKKIPAGSPEPKGTMVDEIVQLPKRYNDDSNMKVSLEAGKVNKHDFQLQH